MESLQTIFEYVDAHFQEMYDDLREICSYSSTVEHEKERNEVRRFLRGKLDSIGVKNQLYPVENGNGIIYGQMDGRDSRQVLFYNHYDVVDGGKPEAWKTGNPYSLEIIGDKMYARGISDDKGSLLTRVHAVEAILAVKKELPVGVKFFWEGDEEIGSPSLSRFAKEEQETFRRLSQADVCLWENGRVDEEGHPWARYGIRGSCCFNLTVETAKAEAHTRLSAIVPNAAWRLCAALATIQDENGRIAIEGFYDHVKQPDEEDIKILKDFPYDADMEKRNLGLEQYLSGAEGDEVKKKIYTEPCFCVCGLDAGGLFQGPRGVIPNKARAMVSFELVADLHPDEVEKMLREHLKKHGFGDVLIEAWGKNVPVKTSVEIPFTKQLRRASEIAFGKSLVIEPLQLGPGPAYIFKEAWPDLPIVGIGPGNNGSNHHGPNENLKMEDYKKAVKQCIALLYTYENESEGSL